MRFPLTAKIAVFLGATLLAAALAAWDISLAQEGRVMRRQLDANAQVLATAIDHGLSASMLSENKNEAKDLVDSLVVGGGPIMRIAIFDPEGQTFYDTGSPRQPMLLATPTLVRQVAATGSRRSAFGRRTGLGLYEVLSPIASKPACFRCHERRDNLGVVAVMLSTAEARSLVAGDRRLLVVTNLAAIVLAVLVLGLALAVLVVRPLRSLSSVADAIAVGDLEQRAPESRRRDEIGDLARAFNSMADRLRGQITDLKRTRAELRETIERVGQAISSAHRLEDLMEVLAREGAKIARAEAATVLFFSEQDQLVVRGATGVEPKDVAAYNSRPLHRGEPIVQSLLADGLTRCSLDPDTEAERARLAVLPGATSQWAVPMTFEGRVLGFISVASRAPCELSEDARRLLAALASQAALAVEQIRLNERTKVMAITDGLTNLYNHRYFQERLAAEVERAARFGHSLALVMLDVDRFKDFNDQHGHLAGDAVLEGLARVIRERTRRIDVAARYGGEEFVVLLIETGADQAVEYAERLRDAVERNHFAFEDVATPRAPSGARITISLGVAVFPDDGTTTQELIRAADTALYAAKAAGRNRVASAGSGRAPS